MAFPTKPGTVVDSVIFNGYKYNRYPESSNKTHQRYYTRTGGQSLHRAIWEFHNGPVPDGHHVHHKDGNHLNNDISNLECLCKHAHAAEHKEARVALGRSESHRAHLDRARVAATEWHRSEEGRAWHREHAKKTLAKTWHAPRPERSYDRVCKECGKSFTAKSLRADYCSKPCWLEHHNRVQRARSLESRSNYICQHCGVKFTAATSIQKYCTTKCKNAAKSSKRSAGVQPFS